MSGLIHDFHAVRVICRGIDCDADHRCLECNDVSDSVMSKYVAHKLSLQCKLQSKDSNKDPLVASDSTDVAAEPAVAEPAASLVPAPVAAATTPHPPSLFIWTVPLRVLTVILCARLNLCLIHFPSL